MYNINKRPITAGLIIAAVSSFFLAAYALISELYYLFTKVEYLFETTTINNVLTALELFAYLGYFVSFLLFGIFIFVGYPQKRNGLLYTSLIALMLINIMRFVPQLCWFILYSAKQQIFYVILFFFNALLLLLTIIFIKIEKNIPVFIISLALMFLSLVITFFVQVKENNFAYCIAISFFSTTEYLPLLLFSICGFKNANAFPYACNPPVYYQQYTNSYYQIPQYQNTPPIVQNTFQAGNIQTQKNNQSNDIKGEKISR